MSALRLRVDEKQHAKEAAKGSYFPSIRNDSSFLRVTDTQLVQINPAAWVQRGERRFLLRAASLTKGAASLTTSGTQITQPLTSLLKIKRANDTRAS